jgi:exonuclease III
MRGGLREMGERRGGIRVASLNVNGLEEDKVGMVVRRMFEYDLDVCMLQDTRLDEAGSRFMAGRFLREFVSVYRD